MITLEKAKQAIEASETKAKELNILVTTTVVDEHGTIIAVSKMDGALVVSPSFAYSKAYTSATLKSPSGDLAAYAAEGKPFFSINTGFSGQFLLIAGGVPVKEGSVVVGGIGVGGSLDVSQDLECAKAAAAILEQA